MTYVLAACFLITFAMFVVAIYDLYKVQHKLTKAMRAVEFAQYMATASIAYQAEMNKSANFDHLENTDTITDTCCGLNSAIYEFRKRIP